MTDKDKLLKMNNTPSDEDPLAELIVPDVTGLTRLDAALAYAEAGFYTVPCRKGTANPGSLLGAGWPAKSSRDPDVIRDWWEQWLSAEIALHAGRSGLVIFDIDATDAAEVPEVMHEHLKTAPKQTTRVDNSTKAHYLFKQPPGRRIGNGTGALGSGWGEVRGSNGVIMLTPSTHRKASQGGVYAQCHLA